MHLEGVALATLLGPQLVQACDEPGQRVRITEVLAMRADTARAHDPFEVHVISMDAYTVDGIRRLEEMGVTDVIVGFRWTYEVAQDTEPLQTKLDALRRYADTVIAATS